MNLDEPTEAAAGKGSLLEGARLLVVDASRRHHRDLCTRAVSGPPMRRGHPIPPTCAIARLVWPRATLLPQRGG